MISYGSIKPGEAAVPARDAGLALAVIKIDGGTQSRANVNQGVVDEYAEAIKTGATFPPIIVFYDGKKHWLADGFHRFHAFQKLGRETVAADIRQGTRRDAILHSVGANEAHGLRRTNDDKRRAVLTLLHDKTWSKWSDGEIAKRCAVSREYVNRLRPKDTCDQVTGMERTFVHPKTGEPSTMKMRAAAAPAHREGGDETKEITTETYAPQSVEGGDKSETPVEEITSTEPRNIVAEILALWAEADADQRAEVLAQISPERATQSVRADIPVLSSLAARESDESAAVNSNPRPNTSPDVGMAGEPQDRNEPVSSSPARKPFVLRPHCLNPELCAGVGANHCHSCKKAMAEGEAA